jgi:hypothetical protein
MANGDLLRMQVFIYIARMTQKEDITKVLV